MLRIVSLALVLVLAACSSNDPRFLLEPPAAPQAVRLPVGSIEVREVSLPAYAEASEIALQDPDGSVRNIPGTFWADEPVRAVTLGLARRLDEASTAAVAAAPWPLEEPADIELEVRVERMLARADGMFELTGQFAVASPDGVIREFVQRFAIQTPIAGEGTQAIAAAAGAALGDLAGEIIARLRR